MTTNENTACCSAAKPALTGARATAAVEPEAVLAGGHLGPALRTVDGDE
jgi:hypothetical protein